MTDDLKSTGAPKAGPEKAKAEGKTEGKKGIRWSRVVLVASLALNLAVVGVVGGVALRRDAAVDRARALQTRDFGFGPFVGAFETDQRRALGRAFARSAGNPMQARREVGQMFAAMLTTLKTEPFDAGAFGSVLLQQQRQFSERQEIGAQLVVDQIAAMSPEARQAYALRLEEMLKRPPTMGRGPHQGAPADGGPRGPGAGPRDD
ncbi:periplasmic heavy metal sensor [Celeribacter neptunius]|uniref:Heavy-metal resistance n=1 Tax=Celeribacter neptunius TaxID=588602 RepID=A0A1I3ILE2_9RHOB|nr:periplasmic heavy metal sensor [Celeribacter neptunius]SFI48593.1 Heavy-metal resistance [Celeribacter neptunius]